MSKISDKCIDLYNEIKAQKDIASPVIPDSEWYHTDGDLHLLARFLQSLFIVR